MKTNSKLIVSRLFPLILVITLALFYGCSSEQKPGHDEHLGEHIDEEALLDDHAGHDHDSHNEAHDESEEEHTDDDVLLDDHAGHDHDSHNETHDESEEENIDDDVLLDDHAGHTGEGLQLTAEQRKRFGIVVSTAMAGNLRNEVSLPGEIVFNNDRVVHLVPRVAGIARSVRKSVGDVVEIGELLAVIESRELADAKSEYLAATARAALAEKNFIRETTLREKQVSSEQDFLESEQALAEARIALRSAEQKLHALGLPASDVERLDTEHNEAITRYEIRSPSVGVVTEKHISLGESLEADADIFTIVDLSSVWVNLTVYAKDLAAVQKGQSVNVQVDHNMAQARGVISMVTPFVDESTRTATALVVLDNSDGRWVPGTFVTGFISLSEENLTVVVPRNAVQNIEGRDVVFVEHEGAFEPTPVTIGRADRNSVEIVAGLEPGTGYVTQGAFQLKATVITSTLDSHAGHGH